MTLHFHDIRVPPLDDMRIQRLWCEPYVAELLCLELDACPGEETLSDHPPKRNTREVVGCFVGDRAAADIYVSTRVHQYESERL
jgi:hypothetical protein